MARQIQASPISVDHQVEGVPAFFDKGPQFINLSVGHMQVMDQMITDSLSMLTSQVQPVENGVGCTMLDPAHGAQAGALDQHRHTIQKSVPIRAQGFKESSFVSTKV